MEAEIRRKDGVIDDLIVQQEQNFGISNQGGGKFAINRMGGALKNDTHLVINLKRKVRDLNAENHKKVEEIESLKRNIRSTR